MEDIERAAKNIACKELVANYTYLLNLPTNYIDYLNHYDPQAKIKHLLREL